MYSIFLNCFLSSHQLDVFRTSSLKDYFVGCTVESIGYVLLWQCFSPPQVPKEQLAERNSEPQQSVYASVPTSVLWMTHGMHLHSLSVSFAFTTKGFCSDERWFCFHAGKAIFMHKQFQSKKNTIHSLI